MNIALASFSSSCTLVTGIQVC